METGTLGLNVLWQQADLVTRGVALMLLVMSIASWCVMLDKLLRLALFRLRSAKWLAAFWSAPTLKEGVQQLGQRSAYAELTHAGINAARQHRDALDADMNPPAFSEWLTRALRQSTLTIGGKLQGGMAILATVGSSAPFVGLLGTVWGIYHALMKIGLSGDASIDKVAGPVGETLIMTALGLAVAIPATLGYNLLVRSNKQTLAELGKFAFELHDLLVIGARATPRDGQPARSLFNAQAEYV
ncbi:MotA/TolQ/ExbB proton channel family protein [Pseudomonas sp. 7P_10.2_Bac1]|uniref:MotA/TolQ/ExbB proton channel family protein n=1 Tax=Pseudomonas sp. 7P_10.2_Bac1 TaxID=2971614 RepID=UPI0021CAABE1|nr:MotA/TolQ/ExbB proton channel family protein [Pseudomonas sp. 7P_10.2_Bac1]MCU1728571.1 MotA/TolQ/ExbB proton channel family protein [Pseudomonas sp. 7P_10.2_Bac1]